jgi:hypothetical protein
MRQHLRSKAPLLDIETTLVYVGLYQVEVLVLHKVAAMRNHLVAIAVLVLAPIDQIFHFIPEILEVGQFRASPVLRGLWAVLVHK